MHGNLNMKLAGTIHKYVVYGTLYTYGTNIFAKTIL